MTDEDYLKELKRIWENREKEREKETENKTGKETEITVFDEDYDKQTKEQLLLISKIDVIIKQRIKELTNAEIWYIRSEIGKVLTFRIACQITKKIRQQFFWTNYNVIKTIQSEINKCIQSKYPFTSDSLVFSINIHYSELETPRDDSRKYGLIQSELSKYLATKYNIELCDKILGNITDWKYDLLNLIESDIEDLCGFPHCDELNNNKSTDDSEDVEN